MCLLQNYKKKEFQNWLHFHVFVKSIVLKQQMSKFCLQIQHTDCILIVNKSVKIRSENSFFVYLA